MTGIASLLALTLLAAPAPPVPAPALAPAPPGTEQGVGEWLERLASGSADERDRAQRWLSANLVRDDYPDLAGCARGADPETARRLVHALGSDDRHLPLAVLLQDEPEEQVAAVGERAFDELVARWCPGAASQPAVDEDVLRVLRQRSGVELLLKPAAETVFETLDRLARLGELGVPLVVSPSLAGARFEHATLQGTSSGLLGDITGEANLSFSGIGAWNDESPGPGSWILVTALGGARRESGVARLRHWCRLVEREGTPAEAAARALGASGWPAALAWLDRRWTERRDPGALEGVLAAAQRGWIARSLSSLAERRYLMGALDQALAAGRGVDRAFALRVARALARSGAMTLGGEDRSSELFNRWETLSEARRYLRLVIAEGQHSGRSDVRERLLEIVEDPRPAPPALRLQGLRALAALPVSPLRAVRPGELGRLVEWLIASGHESEGVALLVGLGVEPPVPPPAASDSLGLFLADWYAGRDDGDALAELLARRGAKVDPGRDSRGPASRSWSAHLARWGEERGPDWIRRLLARALESVQGVDRERLQALALLAGCLDTPGQREVYERLAGVVQPSPTEFELLGALGAGPVRSSAQDDLLRHLASPPGDPERREGLVRGLDRAIAALVALRRDEEASELRKTVWAMVWGEEHPLHESLIPPAWPTRHTPLVVEASRLEREFPPGI